MAAVASRPKRLPNPILANKEHPIPLAEIGRHLPGEPCYDTVWKWWKLGRVNRETGTVFYLETVDLTSGRCSSIEAYWRFIERLNEV